MSASRAQLLHLLTRQAEADQYGGCGGAMTGGFKGETAFLREHRGLGKKDPAYQQAVARFNVLRQASGQKKVKTLPLPRAPRAPKARAPKPQDEQIRTELRKLLKTPRTPAAPILARARALLC